MTNQVWLGVPSEPRHAQRIGDQAVLHVRLHTPAHHLSAKQVDHGSRVLPAFIGGDVDAVAAPG